MLTQTADKKPTHSTQSLWGKPLKLTTCKGESELSSWFYRQKLRLWMASSVDRVHLTTASFQLILNFYCELANLSKWICAYLFQFYCSRYQRFLLRKKLHNCWFFSLNYLTARTTKIFFLKIILFYKSVLQKQRQDKLAHDSACFRWPQLSFSFPDPIFRTISFHLSLLNFLVFSVYIHWAENCSFTNVYPSLQKNAP